MVFLSPILIMLLIFHSMKIKNKKQILISISLVLFVTLATLNSKHSSNQYPNQYNRYYNGLGWALMNAHSWPVNTFNERINYFYTHQNELKSTLSQDLDQELMETSYWPTGDRLFKEEKSKVSAHELHKKKSIDTVIHAGAIIPYLSYFIHHPVFTFQFLKNTYLIVLKSDYSLEYLRTDVFMTSHFMKALQKTRFFLLGHIGLISAAFLLILVLSTATLQMTLISLGFALMPILVALGDGYYEFEKHLAPFLMLIPFIVSVALNLKISHSSK
jgi:hypothetical protein